MYQFTKTNEWIQEKCFENRSALSTQTVASVSHAPSLPSICLWKNNIFQFFCLKIKFLGYNRKKVNQLCFTKFKKG